MKSALFFDLDDTMLAETPAITATFAAVAATASQRFNIDATELLNHVLSHGRKLWQSSAAYPYCDRLGISSWEGLTSLFPGEGGDLAYLREWVPEYRIEVWQHGLKEMGIDSRSTAEELAVQFCAERLARHTAFPGAIELLRSLRKEGRALGVITNGPSDLQREKLTTSGLIDCFEPETIIVSSEIGTGKPDPAIFTTLMERLNVEPRDALMVGDNPNRDIAGAIAAGIDSVWIANGREAAGMIPDSVLWIETLSDLRRSLAVLEGSPAAEQSV